MSKKVKIFKVVFQKIILRFFFSIDIISFKIRSYKIFISEIKFQNEVKLYYVVYVLYLFIFG